jgi:membrane protein required for colicin V production
MALTALDIIVLILVGGSAILGVVRGFVTEALSLLAWVAIVFVLKFFHFPLSHALAGKVGTDAGAAVLAFAILSGVTYFGGRLIANALGARTRTSILGPLDRALGFGFGALKGLIFASLGFLLITLVVDTMGGGPAQRPEWMTKSRTYPLLNITSASMSAFVDRRRRGAPMFGDADSAAARDAADNAIIARHK